MSNDTISNNPELLEEARRAAAEVNLPKLPYDPKAIAREVWDEYTDPKVKYTEDFEGFWKRFDSVPAFVKSTDPYLQLKESEFRQFVASLVLVETSVVLAQEAEEIAKKAEKLLAQSVTVREAVFFELDHRSEQNGLPKRHGFLDIRNGLYRRTESCPDHPEGCEKAAEAAQATAFKKSFAGLPQGIIGGVLNVKDPESANALKNLMDVLAKNKK